MKKVYTVICSKNPEHKFRVVYDIKEGTEDKTSHPTERCPFCDAFVEVTIQGELQDDIIIRKLWFKNREE